MDKTSIIGGKFNMVTSMEENKCGQRKLNIETTYFKEAMKQMHMVEISIANEIQT